MRLDFSAFWHWFADDWSPTRTVSEYAVFQDLFAAYFHGPDGKPMEPAMLSAVKRGKEFLPKNLINTYCETDKHVPELELAVKKHIMRHVRDWPAAGEALCRMIDEDPTIPPQRRAELDKIRDLRGGEKTVVWLTAVLLCAMDPRADSMGRRNTLYIRANGITVWIA